VHWGTLTVPGGTVLPGLRGRMRPLLAEPPHTFAAAVAARGLDTHVAVTRPGQPVVLPSPTGTP
jgi:hypothetical protein